MPGASPASAALEVGGRIGRSFSLGTMLPSLLLVGWAGTLIAASWPIGTPVDLDRMREALVHWSVGKVIAVVLATLVIALAIHPLQFATTQLLEGYWGPTRAATALSYKSAMRHRHRARRLDSDFEFNARNVNKAVATAFEGAVDEDPADFKRGWLNSKHGESVFLDELRRDATAKARLTYPLESNRTMPTRLGNVLRRDEDRVGRQYGLDVHVVAGHLSLVAPSEHADYIADARQQLDTSVRLCSVGLVATVFTAVWLAASGWSLLLALIPYGFAYLLYRGAISAAQEYTFAVAIVLDLNRFRLYEMMGLSRPKNSREERQRNEVLIKQLSSRKVNLQYGVAPSS